MFSNNFLEILDNQDFDAKINIDSFFGRTLLYRSKTLFETLLEEINLVSIEKIDKSPQDKKIDAWEGPD